MESKDQHFAVERIELKQCSGDLFAIFDIGQAIEGAGLVVRDLKGKGAVVIAAGLEELVEAGHGALAALIDDQITRDGEKPGLESGFTVELGAPGQDAHPHFLEVIFSLFTITREEEEVAEETVLVANNELVKERRIFALKSFSYCEILLANLLVRDGGGTGGEDRANC